MPDEDKHFGDSLVLDLKDDEVTCEPRIHRKLPGFAPLLPSHIRADHAMKQPGVKAEV